MRYIIDLTCLMLQLIYFVSVSVFFFFCVHGVYGAFFRVWACYTCFWSIWIWCFFRPSSDPEFFFFWFGVMLTRFTRKPERIQSFLANLDDIHFFVTIFLVSFFPRMGVFHGQVPRKFLYD